MKKTWREKLRDKENFPKVLKLEKRFPCYNALQKMGVKEGEEVVLVNPSEIMNIMRKITEGKVLTIVEICKHIAKEHKASGCCSLTTGIFIMIAANAVEESIKEGEELGIPYWRTLKTDGLLNEKYPGGYALHKKLLENEGFHVVQKGKKYFVENYKEHLFDL